MQADALASAFAQVPCNRFLGLRLLSRSPERTELELPVRPEFVQEEGVVQGGILTALADMAAVYLLWPDLGPDRSMTGTDAAMRFLAAALPARGPLRAIGTRLRSGRTLTVCESEVFQAGERLAKGTFTFLLRPRRPGGPT